MLNGYHATILAYGQTGSGKTHSIIGSEIELDGMVPRAIAQLYDLRDSDPLYSTWDITIR